MRNFISNRAGNSLIEVLICSLILIIALGSFTQLYISALRNTKNTQLLTANNKIVTKIIENVKSTMHLSQVNFDYSNQAERYLNTDQLPMAWDSGIITTAEKCPDCRGRYGYTIQPYEQFRGLYLITIRMTHTEWASIPPGYKDYKFVTSAK